MHRFFIKNTLADKVTIVGEDVHHIKKVLRMGKNDGLIVVDVAGQSAVGAIDEVLLDEIVVQVTKVLAENNEPPIKVILGQGIGKGDKMDFVIQKAVELGVSAVVPLELGRNVVKYDEKKALVKQERWQKIAEQAAKQSKRNLLPQVFPVMSLQKALEEFVSDVKLIAYEDEIRQGLKNYLHDIDKASVQTVFILIGPEGGFNSTEITQAKESGFVSVSLGSRILRTETAAVAALAIVMYELADLGESNG